MLRSHRETDNPCHIPASVSSCFDLLADLLPFSPGSRLRLMPNDRKQVVKRLEGSLSASHSYGVCRLLGVCKGACPPTCALVTTHFNGLVVMVMHPLGENLGSDI